jgi:hypothetical protein
MASEPTKLQIADLQDAEVVALGCKTFSWSAEAHDFYGDAETILGKMDAMSMQLAERRVFLLLVESNDSAEVRFFEQVQDGVWAVSTWSGESLGDLPKQIASMILANQGVHCVGEQVKALTNASVDLKLAATVPAPASPRAAFAHTVRAHGKEKYIRATVALLC